MKEVYVVYWQKDNGAHGTLTVASTEEIAKQIIENEKDVDTLQDVYGYSYFYEKVSFTTEID